MPSPSDGGGWPVFRPGGGSATHGGGEASVMAAVAAVPVWLIEHCPPHPPLRGYFPHAGGKSEGGFRSVFSWGSKVSMVVTPAVSLDSHVGLIK